MIPDISALIQVLLFFWETGFDYFKALQNQNYANVAHVNQPLNPVVIIGLMNILNLLKLMYDLHTDIIKFRKKRLRSYNAIKLINGYRFAEINFDYLYKEIKFVNIYGNLINLQ